MNRLIQIPDFLLLIPFRQCLDERFRKIFAFGKTLNLLDKFIGYKRGNFHKLIIRWFIVLFQPLFIVYYGSPSWTTSLPYFSDVLVNSKKELFLYLPIRMPGDFP